jgi:hypothetical protein
VSASFFISFFSKYPNGKVGFALYSDLHGISKFNQTDVVVLKLNGWKLVLETDTSKHDRFIKVRDEIQDILQMTAYPVNIC